MTSVAEPPAPAAARRAPRSGPPDLARPRALRSAAEALGTGLLVAAVIGSGIMAERLSAGNAALALLANTLATGAALVALLLTFGPVSGAHFNPAVSLILAWRRELRWGDVPAYVGAQCGGGVAGAMVANLMFGLPLVTFSQHARAGGAQLLSEAVASFGLLAVVLGGARARPASMPFAVAAWIVAAYWFTASTSFANPAVTLARSLSDTFAGIRVVDVPAFVLAQLLGAGLAAFFFRWLGPLAPDRTTP
jgi:glycerol uptake facilitator-like aquaporin